MTQMIVYYCVDENLKGGKNEGANNAANTHCVVALFNRKEHGRWTFGDEVDVGQGEIRDFSNGMALGESVTYSDNDPLSTASRRSKIRFNTGGGKLVRVTD